MAEDNSVMFALKELARIEDERIASEAAEAEARAEAERRAAADAERARVEAEAHAARVAEAEARARVERDAELRTRERDAAQRVEVLRAELAAVQADRERLHARITTAVDDAWMAKKPARHGATGWIAAFGAAAVVAGALVAILVTREPVVQQHIVEVPVERTVYVTEPAVERVVADAPAAETAPAAPAEASADRRVQRPRTPRATRTPRDMNDILGNLDCPDDDPTCGI